MPTEEVAAKTYIRMGVLKALEDGQSDQLPEPVFIQALIRRYGDALGLDGTALAKTFPTSFLVESSINPIQEVKTSPARAVQQPRPIQVYLPHMALLAAAASGLLYLFNRPQPTGSSISKKHPLVAQQKHKESKVKSVPTAVMSQLTPIQVTVSLEDQSWLRVVADGKTEFEDVLAKGTQKTWTAQKELTLRAGNAGVVLTSFNQEKPKLLGDPGDVKEVTFTPSK